MWQALGTGSLAMNGGTLQSAAIGGGGGNSPAIMNNIQINPVAGNAFDAHGYNMVLGGNLTGSGTVSKVGGYSLFLSGSNAGFTGTYLNTTSNTFFGSAAAGSPNAAWVIAGGNLANTTTGTLTIDLGSLSGNGTLGNNVGGSAVTYQIGDLNTDSVFSGTIVDSVGGGGTTAIIKTGPGMLTLSGNNGYTGGTTVNNGTLVLNAASGVYSYTGGTININNGSTVRFTGGRYDLNVQGSGKGTSVVFDANGGGTVDTSSGLNFVSWAPGNTFTTNGGAQDAITGASGMNINSGVTNTFNVSRRHGRHRPPGIDQYLERRWNRQDRQRHHDPDRHRLPTVVPQRLAAARSWRTALTAAAILRSAPPATAAQSRSTPAARWNLSRPTRWPPVSTAPMCRR